jgi:hypothetical protein
MKERIKAIRNTISLNLKNSKGWSSDKKIIVFESDDWGSIRMPNKDVYNTFLEKGYPVDRIAYEKFDTLASEDDLRLLFGVLTKFKDHRGKHPVITANTIMGNPDFEKIEKSNFEKYYYEHFTETLKKYAKHHNSFSLWKQGMEAGVFYPQYHGREHLNVSKFMKALQSNDADVHFAFKHNMPGSIPNGLPAKGNMYVEATHYTSQQDKWDKLEIFLEGYRMFEETFGYASKTVIPTNYIWTPEYDEKAAAAGIEFYQGISAMLEPNLAGGDKKYISHKHSLGQANKFGQQYLTRNAVFEPSLFKQNIKDPVGWCMKQIEIAFRWKKPAIITSHRLNFIGYLDEGNRDRNLRMLDELLTRIMKKWPEAEFHHSESLGNLLKKPTQL